MKKTIIILILLISSFTSIGQELDKTFYLLGSLEDYTGRYYPKNNPTQWSYIMTLHQSRIGEIKRIEEIIGAKFKKRKKQKDCRNCQEFYDLKSFFNAKRINSFYYFKKNKEMKDLMGFSFYTGYLKCEKLTNATKNQKISFIAGQFLTVGKKTKQIYQLTLYNSSERFECLIKILTNLECKIIMKKEEVKTIPCGYFIEFIPTEEIKDILDNEILRRNTLANIGS